MKIIAKILLVIVFAVNIYAQDATGVVSGKIKKGADSSALENIPVHIINMKKEKLYEGVTDKDGKYEIKDIKPGLYTIRVLPPKELKLAKQDSAFTNILSGKPVEMNFSLREMKLDTLVFPKGFDEKNTATSLAGVLIAQLTVDVNTPNIRKDGINCHYPVGQAQGEASEGLILFDLSSIPSDATIISAKLKLFCNIHYLGTNSISLHRVKVKWTEKANWTTYDGVKEWQRPGGTGKKDIDYNMDGVTEVPNSSDKVAQWFDFDVTTMVQKWVSKEEPNYGMKTKTLKTASVSCFCSPTWSGTNFIKLEVVVGK